MDFLIEQLHIFAITKNEKKFGQSVDELLTSLKLTESDPDLEWETLKTNFSNIKYINEMMNHYDYSFGTHFYDLISQFVSRIDTATQFYIRNIDFEETDSELKECCKTIKFYLESSLNENDITNKIRFVMYAYDLLIPIVEDFRREKYHEIIDQEFRNKFSPKRLKNN
jgi:hypothetical protein